MRRKITYILWYRTYRSVRYGTVPTYFEGLGGLHSAEKTKGGQDLFQSLFNEFNPGYYKKVVP